MTVTFLTWLTFNVHNSSQCNFTDVYWAVVVQTAFLIVNW